ncbi:hypothetical protein J4219_07230 [Candidatus Woesearchaeota archaeon]|nr:hypothetical protein [Candidatus Woesearchaeota archaeon]
MSKSRRMILDFQKAKGQKIDDIISELLQEPCRQIKEIVVAELLLVRSWPTVETTTGQMQGVYLSPSRVLTPKGIVLYGSCDEKIIPESKREHLEDYVNYCKEAIDAIHLLQQGL